MRLLLIEDNERLAEYVGTALRGQGFAVDAVHTAEDADLSLRSTNYDAAILDLGLPDADGLTLLAGVRRRGDPIPILILSARDSTQDLVAGLNTGADDFLRKPFEIDELVARLRALLRRPSQPLDVLLTIGNVTFETTAREVRVDSALIELGRRELVALELLIRRNGRVISKSSLEETIYGHGEEVASNAIEVLMHRLRKRLQDAKASVQIETMRGIGYILVER